MPKETAERTIGDEGPVDDPKALYCIAWKSLVTGRSGRGTARLDYQTAKAICEENNLTCSDQFIYWPEKAE